VEPGESFSRVVAAARSGSERAFVDLYQRYNPPLVRYFAGRAWDQAEDLAAETWLGVARGLVGFDGDETRFRAWVFTIAHRRLADYRRASVRRGRGDAAPALDDTVAPDDPERSAVESLSGRAAAARIVAALTPEQAEVVLLRVVAGLDVDQVARIVQRRPGTIRVIQHRALDKLRRTVVLEPVTD
jgi:RNA polymerase sigma-70 factor (ECF subfamily)